NSNNNSRTSNGRTKTRRRSSSLFNINPIKNIVAEPNHHIHKKHSSAVDNAVMLVHNKYSSEKHDSIHQNDLHAIKETLKDPRECQKMTRDLVDEYVEFERSIYPLEKKN